MDEFPSAVARPKYDPNAYYCIAEDKKGHSEPRRIKFQPQVWAQVEEISLDRSTPFRSPNDYVRNAVVHQLNRDADDPDRDPAFVRHVAAITAAAAMETALVMAEGEKRLLDLTKQVAELASKSTAAEKDRLIASIRLNAVGVSDQAKAVMMDIAQRYEK